ncbi:MAG: substrate-binding domain-containing protein [Pseudomonadota bacterium]
MNLKQLSEQLNLSQTTVSRALNGYPEVNEATRKRVAEAAQRYRYRPNIRARTLATGKSMSIGHIIPLSRQSELVNMVFTDFVAGAGLVYAAHGFTMTLKIVEDAEELEAYSHFAEHGVVDGVIVQAPSCDDRRIAHLRDLDIPFVVHGRASNVSLPYDWLDVNNRRAFDQAARHLIELGHRRIALINGNERMDFAARRRVGFLSAMSEAELGADPLLMRSCDMSEPNGYTAASQMLDLSEPPTAFVVASIALALGVKRAVEDMGLRAGCQVSIICFDDDISYLPNAGAPPPFAAVRSSVRAAGKRCAAMLLDRIASPNRPAQQELWEVDLVRGASCGPGPFA